MQQVSYQKITSDHLARKAIVYLRQSSHAQVKHNRESQKLQYALANRARDLGFSCIETIDCDLGASASSGSRPRTGFSRLLAMVALGEVGLILSREPSRLSRTDKDWCHLLELCRFFNTLIGDESHIYDVNQMDDQLVLGIKGTLSVVELNVLKMRMLQGKEAKARRGELISTLAPGFALDPDGRIIKDPNRRVQQTIALIFTMFDKFGSLRKTLRWFKENSIEVPVNKSVAGRFELVWRLPSSCFVREVVNNPIYAGAYVYGRRPVEVRIQDGRPIRRQSSIKPPEETKVFIQDHHEGYITWENYTRNRKMLQQNSGNLSRDDGVQVVREGHGLLTGLLRCGRCGRKLQVRYWGKSGQIPRYLCPGDYQHGGSYCLGFGGKRVDEKISNEIVNAISPLGIEASLRAFARLQSQENEKLHALELQLEQVDYECQRAFQQYNRVDPANRLVADTLEKHWNDKLESKNRIMQLIEAENRLTPSLSDQDKTALEAMGADFAATWNSPDFPIAVKKSIARTVIREIIVNLDQASDTLRFVVHWQGGCHTEMEMPRPQSSAKGHKTSTEDLDLIKKMAPRYSDLEIARVLSRLGRRTGKGRRWTQRSVAYIRKHYSLQPADPHALDGILNLTQACKHYGVSDGTIMRLIEAKVLPTTQAAPHAPHEIRCEDLQSDAVANIIETLKRTGKLIIGGSSMDNQEDLFQ